MTFSATGNFVANTNYKINVGTNQKTIRINTASDLVGTPIPAGPVTITGIMSQYMATYQLLLRSTEDIEKNSGPQIVSAITQSNITTTGFRLVYSTEKPGSTHLKYGMTRSLELGIMGDTAKSFSHAINLKGLAPATFYYVQAISVDIYGDSSISTIKYFSTASLSSGRMMVYFNYPVDTSVSSGVNAYFLSFRLDDTLVAYINKAQHTLDVAIYSFNDQGLSPSIAQAINEAFDRGVRVRVVSDGGNTNMGLTLLKSGIPVVRSPQGLAYTIMHNKFIVIDALSLDPNDDWVWTGSTNWNAQQLFDDMNNAIVIQDQALAKAYTLEFEEMWGSSTHIPSAANARFGSFKTDNIPHLFSVNGRLVELYFSPSDNTTAQISRTIRSADNELYFSLMLITRTDLGNAIVERAGAGVFTAGIIGDISGSGAQVNDILAPVLDNRLQIYNGDNIFHHKYLIIDPNALWADPLVLTGSHNWSGAAETGNDENTLIIHDSLIANLYYQEWTKRYNENGGTEMYATGIEAETFSPWTTIAYFNYDYLELLTPGEAGGTLYLTDLQGRVLLTAPLDAQARQSLAVPSLAAGIYIFTLRRAGGAVLSGKVVKF